MMSLSLLKEKYLLGHISKKDYIDQMFSVHSTLFDYSKFISRTDVHSIEIRQDQVIFTLIPNTKIGKVKIFANGTDKRIVPIETLNFGKYEEGDSEIMFSLIKEDYTIFDIGGNVGWYGVVFSLIANKGRVFTFEPIADTFDKLKANIALNEVVNVKMFNHGFSDKEEEIIFYFSPSASGGTSMVNISEDQNARQVSCKVKLLDDFSEQGETPIDFIKCDVEGAELLVFKGGIKTIQRDKPIIFCEILRKWASKFGYHPNDIIKLLASVGYSCFVGQSGKLRQLKEVTEETKETNYFFLHNEKHKAQIRDFQIQN